MTVFGRSPSGPRCRRFAVEPVPVSSIAGIPNAETRTNA